MRYKIFEGTQLLLLPAVIIIVLLLSACTSPSNNTPTLTSGNSITPAISSNEITVSDFVSAVQKVLPSIVKVEVTFGPQGAPGNPTAKAAAGTGWVIKSEGLIVTNNHVVEGAQTVMVILSDGTKHAATAIKTNPEKDLAVVKIAAQNLPAVMTGDSSKLGMGQPVAAIGNALDLGIRVTAGVVSQLDVPVNYDNISLSGLIETDAAINPGNSGGVLINIPGEVVGIPNAGLQDQNLDVENFGYAISINEAMPVITSLITQIP